MSKNTSVLIGDHLEESMKDHILEALQAGESSGFVEFDPTANLAELHRKHDGHSKSSETETK